ncbi:putative mitochondrial carrier domain-containing protein [Rosa chinensis]|uniref:Putative mitochondrial carrier domain-containing protein n=1 Tax=Rosa chinensis TaxID=74649 RepID=A0A2P6QFG0_ROSCH|nr:putative mitochondrial carrier domain-containing protein [Rosa chinensis]
MLPGNGFLVYFTLCEVLVYCGSLWRHCCFTIRVPTEVVKQRMQTGQFTSASAAVALLLLRRASKDSMRVAKREFNDPENAIIGAFAGALTGVITTPLDVIKTRLMVQYKGIVDCVQTIVREEGPPALLKGIGPRVLWIGIVGSIFLVLSREQSAYLFRDDQQLVKTRSRTNL